MNENERAGIFLCECSKNISGRVKIEQIKEKFAALPDVDTVKITNLWCSPEGKKEMEETIKNRGLTKVIIGACSIKQHEKTFMNVLEKAGLNPYLMQMVNIREHVAWVTDNDEKATAKATAQLKAAYERVHHHQPFSKKEIDANPDVVVIGAGLAGCEAALNLASKERKVYLVDKNPSLGGQATKYENSFPALECCSCMIVPKLQEVIENPNIEFLNYSNVEDAVGFFGNFKVSVNKRAKYIVPDKCLGCNVCVEVCPVDVPNEYDDYLDTRKAIYFQVTGATPFIPVLDDKNCLRFKGQDCTKCKEACMLDAVDYNDKDEKVVLDAGAIVLATGFDLFDPKQIPALNYSTDNNIYTSLQFERILSNTGPTSGKLVKRDGTIPKSLVMVHCVGSRDERYKNYCSNICCSVLVKMSTQILEENMAQGIKITHIYRDLTLGSPGMEAMFNKLEKEGVSFVKVPNPNDISINKAGDGLAVNLNGQGPINADMVVLAPAMVPNKNAQKFIDMLMLSTDKEGFFTSTHKKIDALSTPVEGIFVVGSANYPKDITNAIIDGSCVAGKIMSQLIPGEKLEVETLISIIDEEKCSGCKTCIIVCPYKAIGFDKEKGISEINDLLCRGCGTCVVACPSSAITSRHFESDTILAELGGLL
jgi:heterodisulfide reductase subunit A